MYTSKFRIVSVGIILKPVSEGGYSKVYPVELLPEMSGELTAEEGTISVDGVDGNDTPYSVSASLINYVKAQWLSLSTNRITPPDVQDGEQVLLWKFGNEDKYYWTSMGRDDNLRRLEHVSYVYSNISDGTDDSPLTIDNSYVINVSTRDKNITVSTAVNDGEVAGYLLQLNTRDGALLIRDDHDNHIDLYSSDATIELETGEGAKLKLEKENIFLTAPDSVNVSAENEGTIDVGSDLSISAGGNIRVASGGNISINSSGSSSLSSGGSYSISSSSTFSLDSGTTTNLSGGVSIVVKGPSVRIQGGSVSVSGGGLRSGDSRDGGSTFSGDVTFIDQTNFNGRTVFNGTATYNDTVTYSNTSKFDGTVSFSKDVTFNAPAKFNAVVRGDKFFGDFYGTLYGNTVPSK